jgi:two-component system sensor histidine kinase BaeS
LTHQFTGVYERFVQLRVLIVIILTAGLALGIISGWALALNVERPLKRVTMAVAQLSQGKQMDLIPDQGGPKELQQLAGQVNALVIRLRNLEQSRKQLLANLVHELGRPLGALRSAILALQRGANKDPGLQRELLLGMDEETERLQHLVEDLAHLHDQILGNLELDRHPTALTEWLHTEIAPWREAARIKRVHWEDHIPDDLPILEIDNVRMGQALGNLLSNAVKFTPAGGTIKVSAGVSKDGEQPETWIKVSDTGPGISDEEKQKIFTPLYRGKLGRRFPQGMGLGLSIAHDLITAHNGFLELESTPGMGSHFTIHLPRQKQ